MRVTIGRTYFDFRFAPNLGKDRAGKEILGWCNLEKGQIRVKKNLVNEEKLEIVLHECLHASGWHVDEAYVEEFAKDMARVLWKLGVRWEE